MSAFEAGKRVSRRSLHGAALDAEVRGDQLFYILQGILIQEGGHYTLRRENLALVGPENKLQGEVSEDHTHMLLSLLLPPAPLEAANGH